MWLLARRAVFPDLDTLILARAAAQELARSSQHQISIRRDPAVLWPLFVGELGQSAYEIDTCATAIGFLASDAGNDSKIDLPTPLGKLAFTTLVAMRQDDGSWPSVRINPALPSREHMEGVVNDTIFALQALVQSGILNDSDMEIPSHLPLATELRTVPGRVGWIEQSINWIEANRVESGWYYTSTALMTDSGQFGPAVGPTSSMVTLLDDILIALPSTLNVSYRLRLVAMRDAALTWLMSIQHVAGGFGRHEGDAARIGHSALGLLAMMRGGQPAGPNVKQAFNWLISACKPEFFATVPDVDCFDEYQQVIVRGGNSYMKRLISHEYPLEPLCIRAIAGIFDQTPMLVERGQADSARRVLASLGQMLLDRQVSVGRPRGSFRSRRATSAEKAPIYWLYQGILAIDLLEKFAHVSRQGRTIQRWRLFLTAITTSVLLIAYWLLTKSDLRTTLSLVLLGLVVNILSALPTVRNRHE